MDAMFAGKADYDEFKKLSSVFAELSLHAQLLRERKAIVSGKLGSSATEDEITTYRKAELRRIAADEEKLLPDLQEAELRLETLKNRLVRDAINEPYPPAPGLVQYARKRVRRGAKIVLGCVLPVLTCPKGKGKGASTSGSPGGQ